MVSSTLGLATYQTKWNGNLVLSYFNLLFYFCRDYPFCIKATWSFVIIKMGSLGSSQDTEIKSLNGGSGACPFLSTAGGFSCI